LKSPLRFLALSGVAFAVPVLLAMSAIYLFSLAFPSLFPQISPFPLPSFGGYP
jgi:hypothetical protein